MHHEKEEIICPNCGTHASGNYCYECGQSNHLHRDTFGGLILHFFEHYFHYDNKFWQTIRTLLFKPGELTVAYWKQQRMRYISPVSLYIFISAVYFGLMALTIPLAEKRTFKIESQVQAYMPRKAVKRNDSLVKTSVATNKTMQIQEFTKSSMEKAKHTMPKIFFFMIPIMALVLKILFVRRKDLFFVDHLIFSFHYQSFFFLLSIVTLLSGLLPALEVSLLMSLAIYVISFLYFVQSLQTAYKISGSRAVFYTIVVGFIYFMVAAILVGFFIFGDNQIHNIQ